MQAIRGARLLLAGAVLWGWCGLTSAAVIVVPNHHAAQEGNSNNGYPFNLAEHSLSSQRYQQAYAASQFGGQPLQITHLVFRPDASTGHAFDATLAAVKISLSTCPLGLLLSRTFANNIGADARVVHNGPLHLASSFVGSPAGPKAFDIVIPLSTPFDYDPTRGSLLMDVLNSQGGRTSQFDADNGSGFMARVWANDSQSGGPTAGNGDDWGLVTRFETRPVQAPTIPEPSSLALLGLGLAALRRRRAR